MGESSMMFLDQSVLCSYTERYDDTFSQFSGSGVIIAGMNDIMNNFQSLISVPEEVPLAALPDPGKDCTVLYYF